MGWGRGPSEVIVIGRFITALLLLVSVALAQTGHAEGFQMPGGASPPAYRINPGDQLEILVWGDERLQREVRVLPDGSFAFPLVGQVHAAGHLPSEVSQMITQGLQPQYRGPVPQVTVTVKDPTGYQFSVIGKVKSPGSFTPGHYVNALEAISVAGGPTEFAQVNDITILRKYGEQLRPIHLHLGAILKGDTSALNQNDVPFIQSGDTIVVP